MRIRSTTVWTSLVYLILKQKIIKKIFHVKIFYEYFPSITTVYSHHMFKRKKTEASLMVGTYFTTRVKLWYVMNTLKIILSLLIISAILFGSLWVHVINVFFFFHFFCIFNIYIYLIFYLRSLISAY